MQVLALYSFCAILKGLVAIQAYHMQYDKLMCSQPDAIDLASSRLDAPATGLSFCSGGHTSDCNHVENETPSHPPWPEDPHEYRQVLVYIVLAEDHMTMRFCLNADFHGNVLVQTGFVTYLSALIMHCYKHTTHLDKAMWLRFYHKRSCQNTVLCVGNIINLQPEEMPWVEIGKRFFLNQRVSANVRDCTMRRVESRDNRPLKGPSAR